MPAVTAETAQRTDGIDAALAGAREAWDEARDRVTAARLAAGCFRSIDSPEGAFWRGTYLTQGYIDAVGRSAGDAAEELEALRREGAEELRKAVRRGSGPIAARARYILGTVDHLDRRGRRLRRDRARISPPRPGSSP